DLNTAFDRPLFQSHINFLLGRVGQFDRGFVANGDQWTKSTFQFDTRYPEYEFYAQDTWKARPNLTIDIGLRYEIRLSPRTPAVPRFRGGPLPHGEDVHPRQLPDCLRPDQHVRSGFDDFAESSGRGLRGHQYGLRPERRPPGESSGAESARAGAQCVAHTGGV